MKTILVTGKNGALGHAFQTIAPRYRSHYNFVFASTQQADLTKRWDTIEYVGFVKPDYIIHTAALSGGVGISAKHPATLLVKNVEMSINVLEAARIHGVLKTVMSLSSGMYHTMPSYMVEPCNESCLHRGPPHESNYAYAHAKRLIAPLIQAYREEFGVKAIGLVPNGIIGEGDYFGLEDCNMTAALISRFYAAREHQEPIVLWGDGSPLRELTYARDLARAYMWCLENYEDTEILNVGNTEEHSVMDIALRLGYLFGIDPDRIQTDPTKPNGPYRKPTDNNRFITLSDFQYTDLDTALHNIVSWYVATLESDPDSIRTEGKVRI